jgi:tetratricopeptide (TPR) repeat protein
MSRRWPWILLAAGALPLAAAGAQTRVAEVAAMARADSAFDSGNHVLARALYGDILARNSTASRAVFRLAQLAESDGRALALYRRYIALEPDDAWGHMAEGDVLGRMGRWDEGLVAYDGANAIAPGERDVTIGRARLLDRAGRPHDAAAELAAWTARRPEDGEAWDLLGRSRMKSGRPRAAAEAFERAHQLDVRGASNRLHGARAAFAPAITPDVASLGDSDGNRTTRIGGSIDAMLVDGLRAGAGIGRQAIASDVDEVRGTDLLACLAATPAPGMRVNAEAGAVRYGAMLRRAGPWTTGRASARLRARAPGNRGAVDLRVERAPLGSSPVLIANRAVRSEARASIDVPVAMLRVRGSGRLGQISAAGEPANKRSSVEGALLLPLGERVLPSVQYRLSGFDRASAAGYFAPRRAETAEAGVYFEAGEGGPLSLAADLGAGMQRVAEHGGATGSWSRVWRAWGAASLAMGPTTAWFVEVEAYDAPFAIDGPATEGNWRFLSVTAGLRWGLR